MKFKNICLSVLAVALLALSAFSLFEFDDAERRLCDAAGVYDMLSPELVQIYEREIAGKAIVSDKSQSQLERSASRLSVDVNKLKALMLLQDLAGRTDSDISLSELALMSDMKLLALFKQCAESYMKTLPEERVEQLKKMFTDCIKLPIKL